MGIGCKNVRDFSAGQILGRGLCRKNREVFRDRSGVVAPATTFNAKMSFSFSRNGVKTNCGNGVILSLINLLIISASFCISCSPIAALSSLIPKNSVPPIPLAKALTLFNQLFGFLISSATLKAHSVASATNCSINHSPP